MSPTQRPVCFLVSEAKVRARKPPKIPALVRRIRWPLRCGCSQYSPPEPRGPRVRPWCKRQRHERPVGADRDCQRLFPERFATALGAYVDSFSERERFATASFDLPESYLDGALSVSSTVRAFRGATTLGAGQCILARRKICRMNARRHKTARLGCRLAGMKTAQGSALIQTGDTSNL